MKSKKKKQKSFAELSVIAKKAVETRRKLHPEWGAIKRANEEAHKKKLEASH